MSYVGLFSVLWQLSNNFSFSVLNLKFCCHHNFADVALCSVWLWNQSASSQASVPAFFSFTLSCGLIFIIIAEPPSVYTTSLGQLGWGSSHLYKDSAVLCLTVGGCVIGDKVTQCNFDSMLNWNRHINQISLKMGRSMAVVKKLYKMYF